MTEPRLHAGGSGLLVSAGRGGALGWHAPSAGRAHALMRLGETGPGQPGGDGHEDWLRDWAAHPHPYGPCAANIHVKQATGQMYRSRSLSNVTWQTVRDAPWERSWHGGGVPKELLGSHAAEGISKASAAFPGGRFTEGAAGAPSGGHELCLGRQGLLNHGQHWQMHKTIEKRHCPE